MRETRVRRSWIKSEAQTAGGYQSRVGLVSLGAIGRRVARSLQAMDVEILAYDPHVSEAQALALGVKLSSLEQIFDTCDAVSLHTPLLPSTEGMIDGSLIARLKPNATLINTSRGQIIRQAELCRVLQDRPDLTAILDVSETEPPEAESLLWTLPNIFLTPHISGSVGPECARMGRFMVDEFRRMLLGAPLQFQISPQTLELIA
jgi:phosphoglycerate dehydrogenase-like enzyme